MRPSSEATRIGRIVAICFVMAACATPPAPAAPSRLERIQQRGSLGCGIEADVPGFADRDSQGRYLGMDIDVCRALAAAIFGTPDKVSFVPAPSVEGFHRDDSIDLIARRITWELRREGTFGLLFGPVMFYDGQSFLVRKGTAARQLAGLEICVAGGTVFDANLSAYAQAHALAFEKILVGSPHDYAGIAAQIAEGQCDAYSGDVSDLGAIRSQLPQLSEYAILGDMFSKEPLAPLVREGDVDFFTILRWTIFALITAEELGITAANVDRMRASEHLDVRRLLGVLPGNGKALGLSEDWAANAIRAVGNYGEMFERNVGAGSAIRLDRGANRLVKDGGLMFAPPLR
jgi:general L-amino acid transport system substrate-binding protein